MRSASTAFDLSAGYLDEAQARPTRTRIIDFVQANGEALPFADETFDCIWGNAILHHLDLERTGREVRRVYEAGRARRFFANHGAVIRS